MEANHCFIGSSSWGGLSLEFVLELDRHGYLVLTFDLTFVRHPGETRILYSLNLGVYVLAIRTYLVDPFHDVVDTPCVGVVYDGWA